MYPEFVFKMAKDPDFSGKLVGHFSRRNNAVGFSFFHGAPRNVLDFYHVAVLAWNEAHSSWNTVAQVLHSIIRYNIEEIKEIHGKVESGKYSTQESRDLLIQALKLKSSIDELNARLEEMANV